MTNEEFREKTRDTLKKSLNKIIAANKWSQSNMGEALGVTTKSTISNYLSDNSDNLPDILSLARLKDQLGISVDSLLTEGFLPETVTKIDNNDVTEYNKFLGTYAVYYLTSNKISNTPNPYNTPELSFSVISVVKPNRTAISTTKDDYKVFAAFSIKDKAEADELKVDVEKKQAANDVEAISKIFSSRNSYAEGSFELIQKGKFYTISLTAFSVRKDIDDKSSSAKRLFPSDKIMLTGYNPDNTNPRPYIGGGMLCSSISRGSEKTPCSQIILASRKTLSADSTPDILLKLQSHIQTFSSENASEKILNRLNQLNNNEGYEQEDIQILMKNFIDRTISEALNKNIFQLFYMLKDEDQLFYRFLKEQGALTQKQ